MKKVRAMLLISDDPASRQRGSQAIYQLFLSELAQKIRG